MNGKSISIAMSLILFAGLLFWSCGRQETAEANVLKIVATGNVNGEIEPCG